MSQKLNFSFIEEVKNRADEAVETNNAAAVRPVPTNNGEYILSPESDQNTYPKSPYYNDVTRNGSFLTWNPLLEFERHQREVFALISMPGFPEKEGNWKAARLLDFNYWLEVNRRHNAEYRGAEQIAFPTHCSSLLTSIANLYKRYAAHTSKLDQSAAKQVVELKPTISPETTQDPFTGLVTVNRNTEVIGLAEHLFMNRLQCLYFYLWYSILGLNVERINEFQHWMDMMESACCATQMENVSLCISLLAGQWVDDRDAYLAKLRPHFQKHLQRVQNKVLTCYCNEGMV